MKTTVQELKELYAKLGGTADISGVQTDAGMIDAIDSIAGGGGSLSPATADTLGGVKIGSGVNVTSDGTISVSGGGYIVNVAVDDSELKFVFDKTASEVIAAATSGLITVLFEQYLDYRSVGYVYGVGAGKVDVACGDQVLEFTYTTDTDYPTANIPDD